MSRASKRFKKSNEEPEPEPEFQVAPMADMLFVLLVFFMSITTTEVMQKHIDKLVLPYADSAKNEEDEKKERNDIVINVRWNQDTRVADIIISGYGEFNNPLDLIPILQERLAKNQTASVLVRADQDTEFAFVSDVMRAAGEAGIGSVSFGVITGGEAPPEGTVAGASP